MEGRQCRIQIIRPCRSFPLRIGSPTAPGNSMSRSAAGARSVDGLAARCHHQSVRRNRDLPVEAEISGSQRTDLSVHRSANASDIARKYLESRWPLLPKFPRKAGGAPSCGGSSYLEKTKPCASRHPVGGGVCDTTELPQSGTARSQSAVAHSVSRETRTAAVALPTVGCSGFPEEQWRM